MNSTPIDDRAAIALRAPVGGAGASRHRATIDNGNPRPGPPQALVMVEPIERRGEAVERYVREYGWPGQIEVIHLPDGDL